MITRPTIASTIDASQVTTSPKSANTKPQSTTSAVRVIQVANVSDPKDLALQLNRFQQSLEEVTKSARSSPFQAPTTFTNVTCGTGGAKVTLGHNLNKSVHWIVVKWTGAGTTTAPILVGDELDTPSSAIQTDLNTLYLRSYVAGTASIMVF